MMKILNYIIPLIWLLQLGYVSAHKSDNMSDNVSIDPVSLSDINQEESVSEYTGLDDGYDLNKENPIDSVILFCCFPRDFEIHIYKDKVGYVTGEDDEEDTLSEFFTKATLEDIDALFIQNAVPVELSREKSEFYISGNPCYLDLKIYYGDKIKQEKVVFDSKFDIKYSIRFENLYRRLVNIGRLLYQNSYYYG